MLSKQAFDVLFGDEENKAAKKKAHQTGDPLYICLVLHHFTQDVVRRKHPEKNESVIKMLSHKDRDKAIDLSLALQTLDNYTQSLDKECSAYQILEDYSKKLKASFSKMSEKEIPGHVEITYYMLFRAQNSTHFSNEPTGANTLRSKAAVKKMSERGGGIMKSISTLFNPDMKLTEIQKLSFDFFSSIPEVKEAKKEKVKNEEVKDKLLLHTSDSFSSSDDDSDLSSPSSLLGFRLRQK